MTSVIDLRTFLAGAGAVVLAAPFGAEAQQVRHVPTIDPARPAQWQPFLDGDA
jgi:hypothetical protein